MKKYEIFIMFTDGSFYEIKGNNYNYEYETNNVIEIYIDEKIFIFPIKNIKFIKIIKNEIKDKNNE